jgi:hypothetical protein
MLLAVSSLLKLTIDHLAEASRHAMTLCLVTITAPIDGSDPLRHVPT